MKQILKFLIKNRYFLLFLMLEFFALVFTIQNHSYHKSKFINSANGLTGSIYTKVNAISSFFNLKEENKHLIEENIRLKNLLAIENIDVSSENTHLDSTKFFKRFFYTSAKIIKNEYTKPNNYLLIDKGLKNGIQPEMAVINSRGIIGVTNNVSNHNATVISILNKYLKINAGFTNSDYFGTLSWNGKDYKTVQLLDLPRQAQFKIGDTIITGGKSTTFPKGILVGKIKNFEKTNNVYQIINITLFNDMSSLNNVNIITNLQRNEIQQLEKLNNE